VTDTCIPEEAAMRRLERAIADLWAEADRAGERKLPHEFFYALIRSGKLKQHYEIDPKDSWLVAPASATCRCSSPAGRTRRSATCSPRTASPGRIKHPETVRSGIGYMMALADWYRATSAKKPDRLLPDRRRHRRRLPDLRRADAAQDLRLADIPRWAYFCQISDSTTSYGSYSGACRTRRSRGASSTRRARSSSSSPTRRSSRR
jgi:deoxyhypusine synthase